MSCSNTSSSSRRVFIARVVAGGTAIITVGAQAQGAPMVDEKDAQASALGYVADTKKADAKKYPKHTNDQKCSNCQFWQGSASDAWAGCALFGRKQIAASGWCTAYKKIG